jgi:hypothetical protein
MLFLFLSELLALGGPITNFLQNCMIIFSLLLRSCVLVIGLTHCFPKRACWMEA